MFQVRFRVRDWLFALACVGWGTFPAIAGGPGLTGLLDHTGMCDASAAVLLSADLFLVANDEDNVLRAYRRREGGAPVQSYDLSDFLRVPGGGKEADIEGAARLGDRVFWITSHGRNKNGKLQATRYALFATESSGSGDQLQVRPSGHAYRDLLSDLLADKRLAPYRLEAAAELAPKEEGALNIEALAATPADTLLIGLRNPIPRGHALVVPLVNPLETIAGQRAKLGPPIELDLGGLGVRSLEYWPARREYLIAAGRHDERAGSRLYLWSGAPTGTPRPLEIGALGDWNIEAFVIDPDQGSRLQVLSDDGGRQIEGQDCKDLANETQRRFRSAWIELPQGNEGN